MTQGYFAPGGKPWVPITLELPGGKATEILKILLAFARGRRTISIANRVLQYMARKKGSDKPRSRSYVAEALGILEDLEYIRRDKAEWGQLSNNSHPHHARRIEA